MSEEREDFENNQDKNPRRNQQPGTIKVSQGRRDALKAMATVPFLVQWPTVYTEKEGGNVNRNAAQMFRFGSDAARM